MKSISLSSYIPSQLLDKNYSPRYLQDHLIISESDLIESYNSLNKVGTSNYSSITENEIPEETSDLTISVSQRIRFSTEHPSYNGNVKSRIVYSTNFHLQADVFPVGCESHCQVHENQSNFIR